MRIFLSRFCKVNITSVKPFEDIPTPPGGWIPIIGHGLALVKKPAGFQQSWKNIAEMRSKYDPQGIKLLRLKIPLSNPETGGNVVHIFDPEDVKQVYGHEGKYPYRGTGFKMLKLLRQRRPDMFRETTGIVTEDWEEWHQLRSKVQQDMMRPESAMYYIDELQTIGDELVQFIIRERNPDTKAISNFLPVSHKFALESIALIALDYHMGGLQPNPPPEIQKVIDSADFVVNKFFDLLFGFPGWNLLPPRWNPLFRQVEDRIGVAIDFVKEKVLDAEQKIVDKQGKNPDDHISVLEKLIIRNGPDSPITKITAFDMILGGIDTTGNSLSFLLYHLSRHQDKQATLRQEILNLKQDKKRFTAQDVVKMKYLRACLQESFRLTPTIPSMVRVLPHDTVIRGYKIPASTLMMWSHDLLGQDPEMFPDPDQFIPERWIEKKDLIHPYSVRQFSHGPRMCLGKRFAELEIHLAICHLLTNFQVEWAASYEIVHHAALVNAPNKPLVFRFKDL